MLTLIHITAQSKVENVLSSLFKMTLKQVRSTVIVAAVNLTRFQKPNQPTHVLIDKNPAFSRPSVVLLEQIFTIDKERINNFMGLTSEWEMKQIEEALLRSLGINK